MALPTVLVPRFNSIEELAAWYNAVPRELRAQADAALRAKLARLERLAEQDRRRLEVLDAEIDALEHEVAVAEGRPCGCPPGPQLRPLP